MTIPAEDVDVASQAETKPSGTTDQVTAYASTFISLNGEADSDIVDSQLMSRRHRLQRDWGYQILLNDASKGLDDVLAGEVKAAQRTLNGVKLSRAEKSGS